MRRRHPTNPNPEWRAIKRAVGIKTAIYSICMGIVFFALLQAAFSIAGRLSAGRGVAAILILVFTGVLAYILWASSNRGRTWSDHLKSVVRLDKFLQYDPADRTLAPNLDDDRGTMVLRHLQDIAARDDVMTVSVGLLPEDGYVSDRVLIKTFAPDSVTRQWEQLLRAESATASTLRYEVDGERRKVRSLLFIWD